MEGNTVLGAQERGRQPCFLLLGTVEIKDPAEGNILGGDGKGLWTKEPPPGRSTKGRQDNGLKMAKEPLKWKSM